MTELSLHILDIVQNSLRANASKVCVRIIENLDNNQFSIEISDDGDGMDEEFLKKVTNPFVTSRTTRKVGLGISLLKQNAELSGGSLTIKSKKGEGTELTTIFEHNHLDRPMLGDIAGTMTLLIGANPQIRFIYEHKTPKDQFLFDVNDVKLELEDVPVNHPDVLKALKELINENLKEIKATIN